MIRRYKQWYLFTQSSSVNENRTSSGLKTSLKRSERSIIFCTGGSLMIFLLDKCYFNSRWNCSVTRNQNIRLFLFVTREYVTKSGSNCTTCRSLVNQSSRALSRGAVSVSLLVHNYKNQKHCQIILFKSSKVNQFTKKVYFQGFYIPFIDCLVSRV